MKHIKNEVLEGRRPVTPRCGLRGRASARVDIVTTGCGAMPWSHCQRVVVAPSYV